MDQPRAAPALTRLGSHEILRKLARGGMAELFLARTSGPEGFEKLVVLKKILPKLAENPKFVKLFLDEAKIAAGLDHPNIAHVYDMGLVDGNYFFTMEYVHGQDVRATLRRTVKTQRKFPLEHAVQIARNIASALHYAHERRRPDGTLLDIVHRDVSPSNVLVAYDGNVKLVDFGVAKAATSTVKTRTGTLKGKISYMSPEQAKGGTVDRRSDIFALGIVLWEMVTTQRLFKADNDLATIQMIVNANVQPPSELRPECGKELERIAMRALEAEPEKRYQTAEELQLELEELAREQKLNQSTVVLRTYMNELVRDEITAWRAAQASGQTLTDHVLSSSVVDKTTPISESDVYPDEDDEEELEELEEIEGSIEASAASHAPTEMRSAAVEPMPMMTGEVTQQAAPYHEAPTAIAPAPSPSVVVSRLDPTPVSFAPSAFPIAPKEWRPRPPSEPPVVDPRIAERARRIKIGAGVAGGLLVIAIIASRCSGDGPSATANATTSAIAAAPPEQEEQHHESAPQQPPAVVPPAPAPTPPPPVVVAQPPPEAKPEPKPEPDPKPEPEPEVDQEPAKTSSHHVAATKRTPAPAPPPAACEAAALASEGRTQFTTGQYSVALSKFEASLKCKVDPSLYGLAYAAACHAANPSKIAKYYKLLTPAKAPTQVCVARHLDPATGAAIVPPKPKDKDQPKPKKFDPNALDP